MRHSLLLAMTAALSLLGFASAHAADRRVEWTLPTEYEDGTPLPEAEISGVRVEWGSCIDGNDGLQFGVKAGEGIAPGASTTFTITGLPIGPYCVRAYVIATNGQESAPSNVAKGRVTGAPRPPTIVQVDIQTTALLEQASDGTLKLTMR